MIPTILIVRPFLLLTGEGVANHRDGGRDPTELVSTVQPANTARPVETTKTIIPQPVMRYLYRTHGSDGGNRLPVLAWAGRSIRAWANARYALPDAPLG